MQTCTGPARIRAIATLRAWIGDGTLPAGGCLPSERELAARLAVSKPSVHRALQILERDGLISPAVGRTRTVYGATPSSLLAQTVVVLAPWKRARHHNSSGFTDHVAQGAHAAIADAGWHALAFHPDRADAHGVAALLAQRPLGLLMPEPRDERLAQARRLRAGGLPVVVNSDGDGWRDFDRVIADHHAGGAELVRWLAGRGRRRLVTLWTPGAARGWWHAARMAGMHAAAQAAGLAAPRLLVADAPTPALELWAEDADPDAWLEQYARNWLGQIVELLRGSEAADALLVCSDSPAVAVGAACRLLGLQPGVELDVVGYDHYLPDLPYAAHGRPLLQASVDKDNQRQGAELLALLQRRLAGDLAPDPQLRLVPPRLVVHDQG